MDDRRLRAWWSHRQGLDGSLRGKAPAAVLEHSGWARSVGGVGPYLTLFARAGTSRAAADHAVAQLEIHELPTARGCTYVVPASDFAIGLKVGEDFAAVPLRTAAKLGVTESEVDQLCDAVLQALSNDALNPDAIRAATGGASRSLGEEGRRKGVTTTLPLALGLLQARGEIRRVPVNGRLDQQSYQYTRWQPNPLSTYRGSVNDAYTELARRFFSWVGPATPREFQWFSALGVKKSKEVLEPLQLVPAENGSDRLLLPELVDHFRSFEPPTHPQYSLVSSLDAISATRRDVRSLLDPDDYERDVVVERSVATIGGLTDLPSHAILDRGRLIGVWEYDAESASVVWLTFGVSDHALERAVNDTEMYLRDQLGDARSFSLDTPKSRAPRIAALRKLKSP